MSCTPPSARPKACGTGTEVRLAGRAHRHGHRAGAGSAKLSRATDDQRRPGAGPAQPIRRSRWRPRVCSAAPSSKSCRAVRWKTCGAATVPGYAKRGQPDRAAVARVHRLGQRGWLVRLWRAALLALMPSRWPRQSPRRRQVGWATAGTGAARPAAQRSRNVHRHRSRLARARQGLGRASRIRPVPVWRHGRVSAHLTST